MSEPISTTKLKWKLGNHFSKHIHLDTRYYNQLYYNTAPVEGRFYNYYNNKARRNIHGSFLFQLGKMEAKLSQMRLVPLLVFQIILMVLFFVFVRYGEESRTGSEGKN